jgi:hypothetical protein
MSYFTSYVRARRWWQVVFLWFVDVAVPNAHILHQVCGGQLYSSTSTLRKEIATSLLNDTPQRVRRGGLLRAPKMGDVGELPRYASKVATTGYLPPDTEDGVRGARSPQSVAAPGTPASGAGCLKPDSLLKE